ncbi:hypothetical protein J4526_04380 [Desulfurococcaceae archaeon MEX13E-LK6-19]|nr:hypothetical protein J4526_04380 [Desulfurococcaceae archaeon MEX13E-LK6-19]
MLMVNKKYCLSVMAIALILVSIIQSYIVYSINVNQYRENDALYKWVLMFFIPADNSLGDKYVSEVINKIKSVNLTDKLKVVIFIDEYDRQGQIYEINTSVNGGALLVPLISLGECNTGDPRVLDKFINYSITRFPAEYYGLIIIDHSNAWIGKDFKHVHPIAYDEHTGTNSLMDYLTLNEITSVLRKYDEISIIVFDVDHYLSFEVYASIFMNTNIEFLIGSPLTPCSIEYGDILRELSIRLDINEVTPGELAELIVNTTSSKQHGNPGFVLAAFKKETFSYIMPMMLSQFMAIYPEEITKILNNAIERTPVYYISLYYPSVIFYDMGVFLKELNNTLRDNKMILLKNSVEVLYRTLLESRIAFGAYFLYDDCLGLSMYFPRDPIDYYANKVWYEKSINETSLLLQWSDFLNTYYTYVAGNKLDLHIDYSPVFIDNKPFILISTTINGRYVDVEKIDVIIEKINSNGSVTVLSTRSCNRVNEGIYLVSINNATPSGIDSGSIIITIHASLGFLEETEQISLNDIAGTKEILDYLGILNAKIDRINGNVTILNTSIGDLAVKTDEIIDSIIRVNDTFVKVLFKTNETLYGRIVSIGKDVVTIRTQMGDLTISVLELRDNVTSKLESMNTAMSNRVYVVQVLAAFILIAIGLTWYFIAMLYKRVL